MRPAHRRHDGLARIDPAGVLGRDATAPDDEVFCRFLAASTNRKPQISDDPNPQRWIA
jgi:hypothetical protein